MFDAVLELHKGAKQLVRATTSVSTGTETIQAGGTFQLLYMDLTTVGNPPASVDFTSPVAVSGYDTGTQTSSNIWYNLDTTGLQIGEYYVGKFVFNVVGSDTITRTKVVLLQIVIIA